MTPTPCSMPWSAPRALEPRYGTARPRQRRRASLRAVGRRRARGRDRVRIRPGVVELIHTEIDPAFEGRGLGTRLIAGALDDIRARGLELIPTCPFVRAYLRRHPEQRDLVVRPSDRRG